MNKRVYATCHKYDKGKVSRGIVAAIREIGGRFLEYDKQSKTNHDIGDKKAWGKTDLLRLGGRSRPFRLRHKFARVSRYLTPRGEII